MTPLRAAAPAKVNLALAVTGIREDGYHLLRSVFLRLALHDLLEVELDAHAARDSLEVTGALEPGHDNLVLRATSLLREVIGTALPALRFRLDKHIPVAAGLGGGSADAAAAVDLALAAWDERLGRDERLQVALRLGADVPFFAAGHAAAEVAGIGEQLVPLPALEPPAGLVLVTPPQQLATSAVFAELDRHPSRGPGALERVDEVAGLLRDGLDGTGLAATVPQLRDANDLWWPASRLSRGLGAARAAASRVLGRTLLLSGSGPTLFAVYPSHGAASAAASSLRAARPPELEGASIIATATAAGEGDS